MKGITLLIGVLLIGGILFLFNLNSQVNEMFHSWSNLCRQQGGVVQATGLTSFECFKGEKIILHIN